MTRRVNLSHIRVVVVGREYAESGIDELLEWIKIAPPFHLDIILLAAPGKAKEIGKLTPLFEQLPSEVLTRFFTQYSMLRTDARRSLMTDLSGEGFALPYLSITDKPGFFQGKTKTTERWVGIQGAALFQDKKLRSTLPLKEARALTWALEQLKVPVYTVTWNEGKNRASVRLTKVRSKRSARITKEGPEFTVKLIGRADILALHTEKHQDSLETNKQIEAGLDKQVGNDLRKALAATKKAGVDVLRLGSLLDWSYPRLWSELGPQWKDYYRSNAKIDVMTDIKIQNIGDELVEVETN